MILNTLNNPDETRAGRRSSPADAAVFALLSVAAQIAYPLVSEWAKLQLSRVSVISFAAASFAHVGRTRGISALLRFAVVAVGIGFGAEIVGVNTGFPFGRYAYTGRLSPEIAGAAVLVPFAWAMMAWPALVAGRLTRHPVAVGAAVLVTWDLFLDPQMVRDHNWTWSASNWPAINGIPLSNYLGWTLIATIMIALLHRVIPATASGLSNGPPHRDVVPLVLLGWTWFSETVGHLVFFHRPSVAAVGGPAMGAVLAYAWWCSTRRHRGSS